MSTESDLILLLARHPRLIQHLLKALAPCQAAGGDELIAATGNEFENNPGLLLLLARVLLARALEADNGRCLCPIIDPKYEPPLAKQYPESQGTSHRTIFVSYSRKDAKYKEDFERYMVPLRKYHCIDTWSDEDIPVGGDCWSEIKGAMERAVAAVVLVTNNFLASPFCMDVELWRFIQARAERGLKLVPVVVSDCDWKRVPHLERYQHLPRRWSTITSTRKRGQAWLEVVEEIGKILDVTVQSASWPSNCQVRRPER